MKYPFGRILQQVKYNGGWYREQDTTYSYVNNEQINFINLNVDNSYVINSYKIIAKNERTYIAIKGNTDDELYFVVDKANKSGVRFDNWDMFKDVEWEKYTEN